VYVKGHKKGTWLWNLLPDDERERMYIEIFDTVYEGMESLIWMIIILYDVIDTLRIVLCKMYLKYLTDDRDARKNCKIFNKIYVKSH